MFIKIWNFLRGYVKIDISGFSVERLINKAIFDGLVFWDVHKGAIATHAHISLKDYKRLVALAQSLGAVVDISRLYGLPAVFWRFKKRVLLLVGFLFFIAALIIMLSFIWRVDIYGTSRLDNDDILAFLAENDFGIGSFRHGVAYRDVEGLLMGQFSDIAWVSLSITGTRAVIELVESIVPPDIIDTSIPMDVVAAQDGLIVQMATSSGTPLFMPGDVVRQGDIIVSGQVAIGIQDEIVGYEYVRAQSAVTARLYYRMNFEIPLVFYEKTFTGQVKSIYSLIAMDDEVTIPHMPHNFIYYETTTDHRQLSLGVHYPLPFAYRVVRHHELARHMTTRSADTAAALAQEMIANRINDELTDDAQIITKEVSFKEMENALNIEVFLIVLQRIDQMREMDMQEIQDIQEIQEIQDMPNIQPNQEDGGVQTGD